MKSFFKIFIAFFIVLISTQLVQAEEYKILVLPDNVQFDSTNHIIYPDSSVIFASDTINELKKDGRIEIVSMRAVRDDLRGCPRLNTLTKKSLKEFKYNYNIPFVDIKEVAEHFGTNKVLLITSQTDVQNYFLRRTLWDFLNVPGATVIDPAYKLSTFATLIDVDKEEVLWQNTYYKMIGAFENRMIAQSFAPATEQLEKIKAYSTLTLSPQIARIVEDLILPPPIIPGKNGRNMVNVSNVKPEPIDDEYLEPKVVVPRRTKRTDYGMIINDL